MHIREQCERCDSSQWGSRRFATQGENELMFVLQMSGFDYVSLLFASIIVALIVTREIRDGLIGDCFVRQMKINGVALTETASLARMSSGDGEAARLMLIRYLVGGLSAIRRYLLVPNVLSTVILLVLRLGGDTVSVMLNTMGACYGTGLDPGCRLSWPCLALQVRPLFMLPQQRSIGTIEVRIWITTRARSQRLYSCWSWTTSPLTMG